jgi:hypothetical protein
MFRVSIPDVDPHEEYMVAVEGFVSNTAPTAPYTIVCPTLPSGTSVYSSHSQGPMTVLLSHSAGIVDRVIDKSSTGIRLTGADLLRNTQLNIQLLDIDGVPLPTSSWGGAGTKWILTMMVWPASKDKK